MAIADGSVVLVADDGEELLLATDKGLIELARSHGGECWWVTTVLLHRTNDGTPTAADATDVLYDLVDEGMDLHPKVYSRGQQKHRETGE